MHYIALPTHDMTVRQMSFFLAMDEYIARNIPLEECCYMWQVPPSVVFGRNQLIANEVNQDYCRSHGVGMYRRKSGGGCVYADMGNIMFSYINTAHSVTLTFDKYIARQVAMLRSLGIPAYTSGRNDILIDGAKVSGNAFYHLPGRNIVHGTMLYDTQWEHMVGSITPSQEKLQSKGIASVKARMTLLKDHTDISLTSLKMHAKNFLCNATFTLTDDDILAIEQIEKNIYLDPAFIYGKDPRYTIKHHTRIDGCGEIETYLSIKNGLIKNIDFKGDFFLVGDLDSLLKHLHNVPYETQAVLTALQAIDLTNFIRNVTPAQLAQTITNQGT